MTLSEPLQVLIVEDEPVSRALMEQVLASRGHDVTAVEDAEAALRRFEAVEHDLVVLDLKLPGMDGIEFLGKLRELPESEDTVVICVTGVEAEETLEEALAAGADDYVVKPVVNHHLGVRLTIAERKIRLVRERRAAEAALIKDALRDPLTGLPNRVLFTERLEGTIRRNNRKRPTPFAVMVVDLDGLGSVEASHGREVAGGVLVEAGRRIDELLRDWDTVARLQDDEFGVLLDNFRDVSDPTRVAERIIEVLSRPFEVAGAGSSPTLTASVGISLALGADPSGERLVRDAYRALVKAKAEGPGSFLIYDATLHARAVARVQFEADIRRAWEAGEMKLHYMPIVSVADGSVTAFEALLRWESPERGLIYPSVFIPVAEETGLIHPMGWWTMERALEQMKAWDSEGLSVSMGVNVSGVQFGQPDLSDQVIRVIDEAGVDPGRLHLEITETAVMVDADEAVRTLTGLRDAGVGLQVDDFGTGYSSLSYLCELPIDTLKIDRSFVSAITGSRQNREVVRTIVQLARNLGLSVIGEGVETEDQLSVLGELECDHAQGYLFARALPPGEAFAFATEVGDARPGGLSAP